MAYDLAILDTNGKPSKTVAIAVDDHFNLIQFARSRNLSLFQRMQDYYQDAEYKADEIPSFLTEIENAQGQADSQVGNILNRIAALAKEAKTKHVGLVGISD